MYSLAFFQETQNIDTVLSKNVRQKKKNSEVKWGGKWVSARILLKNDNKMFLDAIEVDINGIIIKLPDININPDKETKYLKKKVIHHNIDEEIADLPNITEEATQGLKEDILVSIDENNKSFKKRQLPSPIATTNKRHQQNFHNISTDDDDYLSNTYESVLQTNKNIKTYEVNSEDNYSSDEHEQRQKKPEKNKKYVKKNIKSIQTIIDTSTDDDSDQHENIWDYKIFEGSEYKSWLTIPI
ncbi:uncharacterized protein LOC122853872 [Aphidius gifuensis]|uniref:uncharacterized protein LOC122853872 n=1 Tax=Aphidius gifuensis TaxID=684658 RepID=UPI001CDC6A0D|nr:uncharacterized protein LOC122853872 [Aphidius gifuensis]